MRLNKTTLVSKMLALQGFYDFGIGNFEQLSIAELTHREPRTRFLH